jgi:hypothetical protein
MNLAVQATIDFWQSKKLKVEMEEMGVLFVDRRSPCFSHRQLHVNCPNFRKKIAYK